MSRWNSAAATSPLWGVGLILIVGGVALVAAARRQMRRG